MKNKLFNFTLAVFCCCLSELKAQTMYVRPLTGTQATYAITNIQKLSFSSGNLLVIPISGSAVTHSLSGNRYINFTNLSLATETQQQEVNTYYVYPNPVKDVLNVFIAEKGQLIDSISIFTLEGQLVLQQKLLYSIQPQISVDSLPQGIYLCKLISGIKTQTIKFIKQ